MYAVCFLGFGKNPQRIRNCGYCWRVLFVNLVVCLCKMPCTQVGGLEIRKKADQAFESEAEAGKARHAHAIVDFEVEAMLRNKKGTLYTYSITTLEWESGLRQGN